MKSYASVDRLEGDFLVCEVELIEVEESNPTDFDKPTEMIDIPVEQANAKLGDVQEGDIIVVEHEDGNVTEILCKDEAEKQRRIEVLKAIME